MDREKFKKIVENPTFQKLITGSIIATGILFGLETSDEIVKSIGGILAAFRLVLVGFLLLEIVLKLIVYGKDFFKKPWNIYDLVVITIVLGAFLIVDSATFQIFRVLRLFRLIDKFEIFRKIIETIFKSIPGIIGIVLLVILLIYSYGLVGTYCFKDVSPELFGHLAMSCFTMFQLITIEGWNDVAIPIIETYPIAGLFFISFLLIGSFLLLNMFVSIMVSAMDDVSKEELEKKHATNQQKSQDRYDILLKEIQEIKKKLE